MPGYQKQSSPRATIKSHLVYASASASRSPNPNPPPGPRPPGPLLSPPFPCRRPGVVKTIPTASLVHKRQQQAVTNLAKLPQGGRGGGAATKGAGSSGGGKGGAGKEQTFLDFGQRSLGRRVSPSLQCFSFAEGSDGESEVGGRISTPFLVFCLCRPHGARRRLRGFSPPIFLVSSSLSLSLSLSLSRTHTYTHYLCGVEHLPAPLSRFPYHRHGSYSSSFDLPVRPLSPSAHVLHVCTCLRPCFSVARRRISLPDPVPSLQPVVRVRLGRRRSSARRSLRESSEGRRFRRLETGAGDCSCRW